jgi:hypothetical protein
MKNLYAFLLFTFCIFSTLSFTANASHFSSGYLTYRYIGDSTGIANNYRLELVIFRNVVGQSLGVSNQIIKITPNNDTAYTVPLFFVAPPQGTAHPQDQLGRETRTNHECGGVLINLSQYIYQADIILDTNSTSFDFETTFFCCRDISRNIVGSEPLMLTAHLNTALGSNSLPKPDYREFIAYLCQNQLASIGGFLPETDGDSTLMLSATPLGANRQPMSFASGYSTANPLAANQSQGGFVIDQTSKRVTFSATLSGAFTISFIVKEFRFDTIQAQNVEVGNYQFDTRVQVNPTCDPTVANGPSLSLDTSSSTLLTVDPCNTDIVLLYSNNPLREESIDPAGSDFVITSQRTSANIPIQNVALSDFKFISIKYTNPIGSYDTLRIRLKNGSDGNSVLNTCLFENANQAILRQVINCPDVSLKEYARFNLEVYPNPAKGILNLKSSSDLAILSIFNLAGQELLQVQNPGAHINLESLSAGTYLLKAYNKQGNVVVQKLVIE